MGHRRTEFDAVGPLIDGPAGYIPPLESRPRGALGERVTRDIEDVSSSEKIRALCIARHRFLSDHYCAVFADFGIDTMPIVGMERGTASARAQLPDIVFCEYDLLGGSALQAWREDDVLAAIPIVAVSLTRRPNEVHLPAGEAGITSFVYLPLLTSDSASLVLRAAALPRVRVPAGVMRWDLDRAETRKSE